MSKKAGVGTIKGVGEKTEKLFEKIGFIIIREGMRFLENRFRSVKWRKEKSARSAAVFLGVCRFHQEKEDRSRLHI